MSALASGPAAVLIARAAAQQAKKRGSSFRQPELLRSDRPETAQKVPADKKEKKMPEEAVKRQRPVGIHEARRIRQGKDGAQDAEILKKGRQDGSSLRLLYQREGQAKVHGDAAKLEGKVPPVIVKPV